MSFVYHMEDKEDWESGLEAPNQVSLSTACFSMCGQGVTCPQMPEYKAAPISPRLFT